MTEFPRSRLAGVAVAVLAFAAPASGQDLERGWSLVREDLDVTIDPAAGRLDVAGTMVVRLDVDEVSSGPEIGLNVRSRLLVFDEVHAKDAEIELNVTEPEYESALFARVRCDEPMLRGDEVEIRFRCHSEAQGSQFVVDPKIALASWVEGWYPIVPRPKGVALTEVTKAAGTTTFHLPKGWHAVSNGALVASREDENGVVEVWETKTPLSRSFAAGPYTVVQDHVEGLGVALYLLTRDLPNPRAQVESLRLAIDAMTARLGPYPYPSYAIAEVPEDRGDFGASSEQGFIMAKPQFLEVPDGNVPLFAHEAAHAWWGNTVGSDGPGSLLCTESLAQYGAVIAAEERWGQEGATEFLRFSRAGYLPDQCARGYFGIVRARGDKPLAALVSGGRYDHALADAKGHWVYHMLRRRVGDEVFFSTLRGLIAKYSGRVMTLDDVRSEFRGAAPEQGLEKFFAQWLDRTGAPVLRHESQASGDGIALTIEQMQPGEPFELDLDVEIVPFDGEPRLETVSLHERRQVFEIAGTGAVRRVRLDPRHALLLWSRDYGSSPVPGFAGAEPEPIAHERLAVFAGEYDVESTDMSVRISSDEGHLMLALDEAAPERLVHTGGDRFRSSDGFLLFEVETDRACSFLFVRDAGGSRLATRKERDAAPARR